MDKRVLALPGALGVLAVVACAGTGFAQSPVTADTGWTLVTGRGVPNPYLVHVRGGTATDAANNPAESHSTPARNTLARMGLVGSVTHDGQDPTDEFRYALSYQRDFTINESATVHLSNMLDGLFTFGGGGGGNNLPAGMIAELTVLRRTPQGAYVATGIAATLDAAGNVGGLPGRTGERAVRNLLRLASGDLDVAQANQYRVVATLRIGSGGLVNTPAGSNVVVDARTGARGGQAATLAVLPRGYNGDSRAAVNAGAAAAYGVSGRGVRVGVVEGNLFAHDSLAGRVVVRNGGLNAGEHRSEHSLAVAGIIAARSGDAQSRGIAPDATVYSSAMATWRSGFDLLNDLNRQGVRIVNMSFGFEPNQRAGDFSATRVSQFVTNNPGITIVASAGNSGVPRGNTSTINAPATSSNVLAVGAVNRDFTARAGFSSYSRGGVGRRPDIVAPGEYVLAPGARDGDGNGREDEFRRSFIGTDFDRFGGSDISTGAISGTSFAAPMVSGTVALLHDLASRQPAGHDAESTDSRVMRAVVMNTATTRNVTRSGGGAWSQDTTIYRMEGHDGRTTLGVDRSCDEQLGAGLLNVGRAVEMFSRAELRGADDANERHMRIDVTGGAALPNVPMFWDRQTVAGATQQDGFGMVEYTLGQANQGWHFRSTLAWIDDTRSINDQLVSQYSRLQLSLYMEGPDEGNAGGFDAANPDADLLITGTFEASGTVRMLDMVLPETGSYYLLVTNQSALPLFGGAPVYGISAYIPGPGAGSLLALAGAAAVRRRRIG